MGPSPASKFHRLALTDDLVSEVATILANEVPDQLASSVVLMPTQRLATIVSTTLAQAKGGHLLMPRFMTLDSFLVEECSCLGRFWVPASEQAIQWSLYRRLREDRSLDQLPKGSEHEIGQIFAEFWGEDRESLWPLLADVVRHDIYKHSDQIDSLIERIRQLERLQQFIDDGLASERTQPWPRIRTLAVRYLLDEATDWWSRRTFDKLFLCGFTSINRNLRPLVRALGQKPEVTFVLSEPPNQAPDDHPLAELFADCHQEPSEGNLSKSPLPRPTVHPVASPYQEIQRAVSLIERYRSQGVPESAIAVVVTDEHRYGPLLRSALHQAKIASNFAIASSVAQTPFGQWIQILLEGKKLDDLRSCVMGLLRHPITIRWLASKFGMARAQVAALISHHGTLRTRACGGLQDLITHSVDVPFRRMLVAFENGISPLLRLFRTDRKQPMAVWLAALEEVICTFQPAAHSCTGDQSLSRSFDEQVDAFLAEAQRDKELATALTDGGSFHQFCRQMLLPLPVRTVGEPMAGVQVLSVPESRYLPLQVAIVLGCHEGLLPKALPADHLIDDYLKRRIELRGWARLEAMEDFSFALLRHGTPHLHLAYGLDHFGESLAPSRFIEQLLHSGEANLAEVDAQDLPTPAEMDRDLVDAWRSEEGLFPGNSDRLLSPMSATSLERLIRCPYSFLLHRLGVQSLEIPEAGDPMIEGQWLHRVVEAFFSSTYQGVQVCDPWPDPLSREDFAPFALSRLDDLTEALGPPGVLRSNLGLQLHHYAWPRWIEHLASLLELNPGAAPRQLLLGERERRFGDPSPTLEIGRWSAQGIGAIDAIERLGDAQVVTDYKRSLPPDGKQVADGTAPQLPFYALCLSAAAEKPIDLGQSLLGYWHLRKGQWYPRAIGSQLRQRAIDQGLSKAKTPELEPLVDIMKEKWATRLEQTESGHFAADPSDCGYCRFHGICRRDDPYHGPRLEGGVDELP